MGKAMIGTDELVVTAALRAAVAWTMRDSEPRVWRELSRMTGVISFALGPGAGPQNPVALIRALQAPIAGLLPDSTDGGDVASLVLLDDAGRLTPDALDRACEYTQALFEYSDDSGAEWLPTWAWQRAETVQRTVYEGLREGTREQYTAGRRYLIENPAGLVRDLIEKRNARNLPVVADYTDIPRNRVLRVGDREWWWPCPECRWPMRVKGDTVMCEYTPHDARFQVLRDGNEPPPLINDSGKRRRQPAAISAEGAKCLDPAVWRFVVVPGIAELVLERRLARLSDVTVTMWPDWDRYDLTVSTSSGVTWHVDVKDHTRHWTIAQDPPAADYLVLPDYRRAQVLPLRRMLPHKTVLTTSKFIARVRAASKGTA